MSPTRDWITPCLFTAFITTVLSAPIIFGPVSPGLRAAPKPRPAAVEEAPAPPDRVAGTLAFRSLGGPVVITAGTQPGTTRDCWLVFASPAFEAAALKDLVPGKPLVAVGRLGGGGGYCYLVVESVEVEP